MIGDFLYKCGAFLVQAQAEAGKIPEVTALPTTAATVAHSSPFVVVLQLLYSVICIGLIIAVMLHTTKSEGLSGMMGGATQSIFRGKKSFEDKISTFTTYLAAGFIIGSFVIFILIRKF